MLLDIILVICDYLSGAHEWPLRCWGVGPSEKGGRYEEFDALESVRGTKQFAI